MSASDFTNIITIDGQSGTGKGTIAQLLAHQLGWHYLDSGVLYRATAWAVNKHKVDTKDPAALKAFIQQLQIELKTDDGRLSQVLCDGEDVTTLIRSEACSMHASKISAIPLVRELLLQKQYDFATAPGLVTDGRDMGTVIFPQAKYKFFFTASVEVRAKRRVAQLAQKGIETDLNAVEEELALRDYQDTHRDIAPLKPAADAVLVDTSEQTIEQTLEQCLQVVETA